MIMPENFEAGKGHHDDGTAYDYFRGLGEL